MLRHHHAASFHVRVITRARAQAAVPSVVFTSWWYIGRTVEHARAYDVRASANLWQQPPRALPPHPPPPPLPYPLGPPRTHLAGSPSFWYSR